MAATRPLNQTLKVQPLDGLWDPEVLPAPLGTSANSIYDVGSTGNLGLPTTSYAFDTTLLPADLGHSDPLASAAAPDAASPLLPPRVDTTWAGVTQAGAQNFNPPDLEIAVGTRDVITSVNGNVSIYTKAGTLESSQTLNAFFGLAGGAFVFDPRAMWDEYAGRFIIAADEQTATGSFVHFKVSKTSNPADGWWNYDLNTSARLGVGSGDTWLDYPEIGFDSRGIYITGNRFTFANAYVESDRYVIDKNVLESGGVPTVLDKGTIFGINPVAFNNTIYASAHTYGNRVGLNGTFMVAYQQNNAGADSVDIIRTDYAGGAVSYFNHVGGTGTSSLNIGDISNLNPVGGRQTGSAVLLDSGDSRMLNAIWRDNHLFAVTEIRVTTGGVAHDVAHWFEFNTTNLNNIVLENQGDIDFGTTIDTFYGNLTVDALGNFVVGFSFSGTNNFGGASRYVFNPAGVRQNPGFDYHLGQGVNTGGRWGDYSGIAIDPTDNLSFYAFNEWATATNTWATTIDRSDATNYTGSHIKTNDFTGSAVSSILWQNDNGTVTYWKTGGVTLTGAGFSLNPGASWHVIGSGDLNGDAYADVVLQNNDGSVAVWQVKDNGIIGGGTGVVNPGPAWTIKGQGDFNGDGRSDLVLQNTDGSIVEWFMNGTGIIGGGLVINPGSDWKVIGSGDFNGDGRGDLVLQSASTGGVVVWTMNGLGITGGGSSANPGASVQIKGIGDFNGDGNSDLLLFDTANNNVYVWLMASNGIIGGGLVGNPGAGWSVQGAGDFNGDGHADILWQYVDGTVDIWTMNGSTNQNGAIYGNPGATWHAIAH